jgi:hypothetical protein
MLNRAIRRGHLTTNPDADVGTLRDRRRGTTEAGALARVDDRQHQRRLEDCVPAD